MICTRNSIVVLPSFTFIKIVSTFQDSDIITSLVCARIIVLILKNDSAIILYHLKSPRFVLMMEFIVDTI